MIVEIEADEEEVVVVVVGVEVVVDEEVEEDLGEGERGVEEVEVVVVDEGAECSDEWREQRFYDHSKDTTRDCKCTYNLGRKEQVGRLV